MEKSTNSDFLVNVVFQNGNFFTYRKPSDTHCIQLSGCTYWETAKTVRWQNLPAHWHIDFFQNRDCTSKDGDVHHVADTTATTGLHIFTTTRPIRSIHARPALGKRSWKVAERCVLLRKHGGIYESEARENSTESNDGVWTNDTSEVAGSLSSNWSDQKKKTTSDVTIRTNTMEKSNTFEMRVVLESGDYFSYTSPSETVCIMFANCPNWKPAKTVFWRNLPGQGSIDFYQSDKCNANDGDVYVYTGKQAGTRIHTFKTPRAIRSMYARPLWGDYKWNVARKCVQLRQPAKRAEATSLNNEASSGSEGDVNGTE